MKKKYAFPLVNRPKLDKRKNVYFRPFRVAGGLNSTPKNGTKSKSKKSQKTPWSSAPKIGSRKSWVKKQNLKFLWNFVFFTPFRSLIDTFWGQKYAIFIIWNWFRHEPDLCYEILIERFFGKEPASSCYEAFCLKFPKQGKRRPRSFSFFFFEFRI